MTTSFDKRFFLDPSMSERMPYVGRWAEGLDPVSLGAGQCGEVKFCLMRGEVCKLLAIFCQTRFESDVGREKGVVLVGMVFRGVQSLCQSVPVEVMCKLTIDAMFKKGELVSLLFENQLGVAATVRVGYLVDAWEKR